MCSRRGTLGGTLDNLALLPAISLPHWVTLDKIHTFLGECVFFFFHLKKEEVIVFVLSN